MRLAVFPCFAALLIGLVFSSTLYAQLPSAFTPGVPLTAKSLTDDFNNLDGRVADLESKMAYVWYDGKSLSLTYSFIF